MGMYFYKHCFFVHLESTFQKTLEPAPLHCIHCPRTGVAASASQVLLSLWPPRKGKSLTWNESLLPPLHDHWGRQRPWLAEFIKGIQERLIWTQLVSYPGCSGSQHTQLRQFPPNYFCIPMSSFNFPWKPTKPNYQWRWNPLSCD